MALPAELPAPRTPDPMDAPPLRWGILGTGWIAYRFCAALGAGTRQQLVAVGSRSFETARAFAEMHHLPRAHASYAELVADPEVDVVYVATPHNHHHDDAALALEAGKHVLVEKPMCVSAAQARSLGAIAESRGRFLMEAMWALFLPKFDVIRQLLESGSLGAVRAVVADIGEHFEPSHRIWRADLAGGPLMDLGTYPLTLATWVLGEPANVQAMGTFAPDGLNVQAGMLLRTGSGALATLHATQLGNTPTAATIQGEAATVEIAGPFYQPGPFRVRDIDGTTLEWDEPRVAHSALHLQAAEVARQVAAGQTGSPLRRLADTIAYLEVMDEVRRQLGISL
ncbi:MAG: Gfo/Idh/MocA family oxidoreductase [Intrasporangium sp.]|uniref:Gfo/Idh/MocA family protein n=1 Tax=Intrasporangium sp. TaxID=1925024 RepID=UPI002649857C|nr:Gfo/Idh/MocA family oxidoreductase [Intrasporangium sp.]MDN5797075.1 Gfo/Idh/MocA family oxidoreductase [Intrasporangium sp.]